MNELNYPIKYAVLGIEEQVGWVPGIHNLEREYDICGYIVSKAYIVGELISYNHDGTYTNKYQIVFPFSSIADNEKQIPRYNMYSQCYNSINVYHVFDDFDEAKKLANELNNEIRSQCCLPKLFNREMSYTERLLKGREEFDKRFNRYLEFEKFISKKTIDMEITPDEKMKSRIRKI